jgi:hypothetical protein
MAFEREKRGHLSQERILSTVLLLLPPYYFSFRSAATHFYQGKFIPPLYD